MTFDPTALATRLPVGSVAHHRNGGVAGIVDRVGQKMVWLVGQRRPFQGYDLVESL